MKRQDQDDYCIVCLSDDELNESEFNSLLKQNVSKSKNKEDLKSESNTKKLSSK